MTGIKAITSDQIERAVKTLKQIRPVYSGILTFYGKIFIAQEAAKSNINLKPIQIPAEELAIKTREKLPLVNMTDFVIDVEAGHILFKKICEILHYFFSAEEKDYRIYVCDNCKKYLKTGDSRKADRLLYPPLEQVSTLHLDFKAQKMGFESGMQLELSV